MSDISALLIQEPPLQVLPTLACRIGLNEALVLQQLHYLLRDPRHGKRIAEHQWIFNTYEQWVANYFPFWSVRTMERTFASLSKMKLVICCQPEGRISRRKYYRIDFDALAKIPDPAKLADSMPPKRRIPITKTTVQRESKETSPVGDAGVFPEIEAIWKPISSSKAQQLKGIRTPRGIPSERQFEEFIADEGLDHIGMGKGGDLYARLSDQKWHHWAFKRVWRPINDWRAYVRALDAKMERATKGF